MREHVAKTSRNSLSLLVGYSRIPVRQHNRSFLPALSNANHDIILPECQQHLSRQRSGATHIKRVICLDWLKRDACLTFLAAPKRIFPEVGQGVENR